ncbi:isoflavone 7-O-methyltransferase-like [Vigna radiata var. radiata]|uniref:isoflavone 7-O-methyltransferase n=1 Tax=Vigna radiata var. radiata TaxID=3916 RepID=A0A1S3TUX5_VIGRR|nr:isoflavone 7-O-methyltransferase-like [Vigna radiata var. radiata]
MASNNVLKASEIFEGQVHLYKHLYAHAVDCMSIKWMIELGIPDIIHNHGQPISLSKLVSILQIPPSKVRGVKSLLRYLAHNGFLQIVRVHHSTEEKEAYSLTSASQLLVKGTDLCLAPMVEAFINPSMARVWSHLKKWTYEDDITLFDVSLGSNLWDFLSKKPEFNETFNEAMASDSQMMNLALRGCKWVFEGVETIVDVGGGTGNTAKAICHAFPNVKCTVFDRPQVVEKLSGTKNLTYVGGDMFESIPKADAVLLKWILHDWSDKDSKQILENCKEAICDKGKRGKVIVIDVVMKEDQDELELTGLKLLMDVHMACLVNGKERTEEEWKKLVVEAGFQSYKVSPFTGYLSLIQIFP